MSDAELAVYLPTLAMSHSSSLTDGPFSAPLRPIQIHSAVGARLAIIGASSIRASRDWLVLESLSLRPSMLISYKQLSHS